MALTVNTNVSALNAQRSDTGLAERDGVRDGTPRDR